MGRGRYPTIATAITAFIAQACGLVTYDPVPPVSHDGGGAGNAGGGAAGSGTGGSFAGTLSLGTAGTLVINPQLPNDCPAAPGLLRDQVVTVVGAQRTFYSWTTREQVEELRAGGELFSRSERPGEGRGLLFDQLAQLASAEARASSLARVLAEELFAKARFAWPNPWATLLGFPGESYGDQLLAIELKPEAWIAHFERGDLRVLDSAGQQVPLEVAELTPERIGAIYFLSFSDANTGYCGTFSQGGVAFREFALGNLAMVARWSLATPEIVQRMQKDLKVLREFEQKVRCWNVSSSWSMDVECAWERGNYSDSALDNYMFSLGLPSELYRPTPENLAALIASVEACLPTGEPLVVTPGE